METILRPSLAPNLDVLGKYKTEVADLAKACSNALVVDEASRNSAVELAKFARTIETKIEAARTAIKAPYLQAGKLVDETAKAILQNLDGATLDLRNQIKKFDIDAKAKIDAEIERIRKEAEAQQKILIAERDARLKMLRSIEAAKTIEELNALNISADLEQEREARREYLLELGNANRKEQAEIKRMEALRIAEVKDVEKDIHEAKTEMLAATTYMDAALTKQEAPSTLRSVWTYEVVDIAKVPKEFVMVNAATVKDAIRGGERNIKGLRIYQEQQLALR